MNSTEIRKILERLPFEKEEKIKEDLQNNLPPYTALTPDDILEAAYTNGCTIDQIIAEIFAEE